MISRTGGEWLGLKQSIEKEIARLHGELEIASAETFPNLQGQVVGLRSVIAMVEPIPTSNEGSGTDYMRAHDPA